MLTIHAQESRAAVQANARDVVAALREIKLPEAAKKVEDGMAEMLAYMDFPINTGSASAPTTSSNTLAERFVTVPEW